MERANRQFERQQVEEADDGKDAFEQHFTVKELAAMWQMSEDFVRRVFRREAGVIVFHAGRAGKRIYRTLRIPKSVAERVHARMTIIH